MTDQPHDTGRPKDNRRTETDDVQIVYRYLENSIMLLHKEKHLRPMSLGLTLTDENGTTAIGHVNINVNNNNQGQNITMDDSYSLGGMTQGELSLSASVALAMFHKLGTAAMPDTDTEEE